MKLWKKILIVFVCLLLLIQIPFIYRRYELGRLSENIKRLNSEKEENPLITGFDEYKGVIHVHTSLGGHSTGSFEELIPASQDLDFVLMTEHTSALFDTSAQTLKGQYGRTLFVNGQEVDTASGDRFLLIPGHSDSFKDAKLQTDAFIEKYKAQERLILVAYPERLKSLQADFDGIEVFSLNTNAKKMNPFTFFFDALWSFRCCDRLLLSKYFMRPDSNLKLADELARKKKLTIFAGTDAHSNIGFHLLGDDAGNKLFYLKFDPYERIFSLMRNHVLIRKGEPLNEQTLLQAVKDGKLYVCVDVWGDPKGFSFTANDEKTMGDEILIGQEPISLKVSSPLEGQIKIFRNGEKIFETFGKYAEFQATERGAYRVEIYLSSLGLTQMPWIISNPIYIR
ncbi:MAG: hypothetical protein D6687_02120 [Acidobacteria bacterium]|jgi:hypothetical protein|nr:MAG: hypothetical protein D6687_02120 [Acidobacteriota bacterium]GIU81834.1 MAG: hypothetical protein KatS3mg006_0898 [Pyrinomonadaceae bacterium]